MIIVASALHARLDATVYANVGLYGPVFVECALLIQVTHCACSRYLQH